MTAIKICGVTTATDATHVAAAGPDYIGLNFWPQSKRYLSLDRAAPVAAAARAAGPALLVGVFVNPSPDELRAAVAAAALDFVQLHGDEDPARLAELASFAGVPAWKALPVAASGDLAHLDDWPVDVVLLDTASAGRGGSGHTFDWQLARDARTCFPLRKLMLAGGLDPSNVASAIAIVGPWGVDVASGVESAPGIKDAAKVIAFIAAARAAARPHD